ncbi:class V aminotransferase, partial [Robbsia andropogonis]
VERARAQVADLIRARPDEIIWTSGATESNNLALKGYADNANGNCHFVTSQIEHKAILDTMASLEQRGYPVTYVRPDERGEISLESIKAALRSDTGLVSLMLVNNEIGTLTNISEISGLVHAANAILHVDAAQGLGKTAIDVKAMGIDLMSMSAHKVYGPKGIGALYVNEDVAKKIAPQMHGGGHERGLRSGTLPTHQIVGMGVACELASAEMMADNERISRLHKRFLDTVSDLRVIVQNAARAKRIPHMLSLTFDLPGFFPFMLSGDMAISSTSACNSAAGTPSHVLTAIGLDEDAVGRTVRISFGRYTTEADVDHAIACVMAVVSQCSASVA